MSTQSLTDPTALVGSDVSLLHSVLDWFAKNPALAASFIAASVALAVGLLTYRGVLLSNREATKRLRDQLSHDASQQARNREHSSQKAYLDRQHESTEAQKERLTTLRREVYLVAVPELIKAQAFLARLPHIEFIELTQLSPLEELASAVGKVAIVGTQPTALKARKLLSMYGELFLMGLGRLKSSTPLKIEARLYQNAYNKSQAEIERIIKEITLLNEKNRSSPEAVTALSNSFDIQQSNAARSSEELQEINIKINQIKIDYYKEFIQEIEKTAQESDELLCLLRSELGLAADLQEFLTQSAEARKSMRAALQNLGIDFDATDAR